MDFEKNFTAVYFWSNGALQFISIQTSSKSNEIRGRHLHELTALPILQDMPWLYLLLHVPLCDTVYPGTNKILYLAWQYCQTNTSLNRLAVL